MALDAFYLHALKNALIPVITVVGLQLATILSGSAIIETVFAWPGIGALAVQSIGTSGDWQRDVDGVTL